MNTDQTETGKLLLKKETEAIIGCAIEVSRELRQGLIEKPYERALVVEFERRGIPVSQQERFTIYYKGVDVGTYVPDLVVFDKVVVDTKVIFAIGDPEIGQMLNYLAITGLRVGLILNFKYSKLSWKRVVR